ncbi:hypothetical protein TrVE_jg13345 [Triparma verrucosa]|uniref:Glycerol-3-phosphate dehydrogenase n=1 Tax=Triparma verrucosa TaxID=1606542 RepID=A0A9W7F2R3_9STRA|nr:hypothetical protein TrVE_jg13345 [Triparma verrucosa]
MSFLSRFVPASLTLGTTYALCESSSWSKRESTISPIRCVDGTTVVPYRTPSREEQIKRLKSETFDVLVIGGGSAGSGVALDASTRGLSCALLERSDFGSGTSSRSTKLIHGGIRYLENAFKNLDMEQYDLVKEALAERGHMLKAAPYMNSPLPIMIPMYCHNWYDPILIPYYLIGAKVYDFVGRLQGDSGVPHSHFIDVEEAKFQFPMINEKNLWGAIVYYDGQMNDSRMNLHLALTATQAGAAVASRMEVTKINKDKEGKTTGVTVRDNLTGKSFPIKAKVVVNATGPFSDAIRKLDNPDVQPIIKGAAGVHVVLPDHYSPDKMGLIVPKTSDGRVLFFLPWEGATISGTTDSETEMTEEPSASDREVNFILEEANNYLKLDKSVSSRDVRAAWSGIRPLVMDPAKGNDTKAISRTHVIEVSPSNVVTIAGGKWTTYRRMAEDTVDKVIEVEPKVKDGKKIRECITLGRGIIGADRSGVVAGGKFDRINITLRDEYHLPKDVAKHLVANYGTRALQIAELCQPGGTIYYPSVCNTKYGANRLHRKYAILEAEVVFAVRHEYAFSAQDVLARRTRLAFIDSDAAEEVIERVVELMGNELKWGSWRRKQEVNEFRRWLKTMNMEDRNNNFGRT